MVGYSHRIQLRQILVEKKEVADLLKETIHEAKAHSKRVQTLMRLAEKYSICSSKKDGGNLGWIELSSDDPRGMEYTPVLKNVELEKLIRENVHQGRMTRQEVFGPVKTDEGYHLLMIANEFGATHHSDTY